VRTVRQELAPPQETEAPPEQTRKVTRGGKQFTMRTERIGAAARTRAQVPAASGAALSPAPAAPGAPAENGGPDTADAAAPTSAIASQIGTPAAGVSQPHQEEPPPPPVATTEAGAQPAPTPPPAQPARAGAQRPFRVLCLWGLGLYGDSACAVARGAAAPSSLPAAAGPQAAHAQPETAATSARQSARGSSQAAPRRAPSRACPCLRAA
jgi:hypothetical protein